jgi:hypothetical protein
MYLYRGLDRASPASFPLPQFSLLVLICLQSRFTLRFVRAVTTSANTSHVRRHRKNIPSYQGALGSRRARPDPSDREERSEGKFPPAGGFGISPGGNTVTL